MDRKKSGVWAYFRKVDAVSAECSKCASTLKCRGGSTSALRNHLKLKHKILPKATEDRSEAEIPMSAKKPKLMGRNGLDNFVQMESLGELLAKCAARDGFSIHGIANSTALKEFVAQRNYVMPRFEATIRDLILGFSEEKKIELRATFSKLTELGQRFSIAIDEWSIRKKRLLCITLRTNKQKYCLGLINIPKSCDAEKIKSLIREKLLEFNLKLNEDVVGATHDGASAMQTCGELPEIGNHLCYNQAIRLAVMDVFYKKKVCNICEHISVADSSDSDYESEDEDLRDNFNVEESNYDEEYIFDDNVLVQCRKIVKHFKKSAINNLILQNYVIQQEGKQLPLLLDRISRWNSLIPMFERLLKLKNCVKKALKDTGHEHLYREEDFVKLQNIIDALKPVEHAVIELSKDNATLISAEAVFKMVFEKLQELNSSLSLKMYYSLKERITERRNKLLVSLQTYLQHGNLPIEANQPSGLSYATIVDTLTFAKSINERLFMKINPSKPSSTLKLSTHSKSPPEIEESVSSFLKTYDPEIDASFKIFEAIGPQSTDLKNLLNALNTIRPASTSTDCAFSVGDNLCTTVRSGLQFDTLNALVFLKSYFLREK